MFETSEAGVLYTEHSELKAVAPGVASLWSFETRSGCRDCRRVRRNANGSHEYWLDRSDPLLNTILPGTGVSLVVNFGELWAVGRSLTTSAFMPRACVIGPVTESRILRVGRFVHAIDAGLPSTMAPGVFGVPASELAGRIVALGDLWPTDEVERLLAFSCLEIQCGVSGLKDALVARIARLSDLGSACETAARLIALHAGRVSIEDLARSHGLTRQQFARTFRAAAGLPPKLFARITRFQALVRALLSTDVSRWASASLAVGYYDQAHMINEFRMFAGSSPTVFFRPHGDYIDPSKIQLRGRPSEWLRQSESLRGTNPSFGRD